MRKISLIQLIAGSSLLCFCASGTAQALEADFSEFTNPSSLTLNGAAQPAAENGSSVLQLTNDFRQSGSAFLSQPLNLTDQTSFSSNFQFRITDQQGIFDEDGVGSDGLAFVLQSQSPTAIGTPGGALGLAGISPSVGVEVDTFNNATVNDISGNHIGININGTVESVVREDIPRRLNNSEIRNAWVDYDGISNLLEVRLSDVAERPEAPRLSYTIDLPALLGPQTFVGFTGATGDASGDQDIVSWQYRSFVEGGAASDSDTDGNTGTDTDGNAGTDSDRASVPEHTSVFGLIGIAALGLGAGLRRHAKRDRIVAN